MTKAVVFFDLDGTLMQDDKTVAADTLQALADLRAGGNLPVIATGRDLWELAALRKTTGINTLVAGNGATIVLDGDVRVRQHIAPELVARVSAQAAAWGYACAWYSEDGAALSAVNALTRGNYEDVHQVAPPVDPGYPERHGLTRMLIFVADNDAEALKARFAAAFPELAFYHDSPFDIDLIERRLSKASGIRSLLAQPELAGVTTYAFGDGDNDLPMRTVVDQLVAMGNASPAMLDAADFVTADNMHGGIVAGLRHYGLI
ncbi:Cof-type HAD-IIB family hydrolase [Lacticaseibacillus songhuajiangensis]|jgi:Cof subfamily protein (haloacid dehalogenase superfamily)|uniref:Cof-type HAD-IIB family hydrolase n=1 Tax=Lacticaseibacillus songhuajiangensis TaxID=1296539 RepID=UPI000F7B6A2C|nr:Cof-type HAD-IIB family hydrolase [Lacticaseibacillus songhuajiangensis]